MGFKRSKNSSYQYKTKEESYKKGYTINMN